jgi:hypothetical protein
VADPLRGTVQTEEKISPETLLRLTREAGAEYLLYVTIDRPAQWWVKVGLEAFDIDGKLLWREAATPGMWDMTGNSGLKTVMRKLEAALEQHLGKPGLPVMVAAEQKGPQ